MATEPNPKHLLTRGNSRDVLWGCVDAPLGTARELPRDADGELEIEVVICALSADTSHGFSNFLKLLHGSRFSVLALFSKRE